MKAILIKYLPMTNTKPVRLKVSAEGVSSKIYPVNMFDINSHEPIEQQAAILFASGLGWLNDDLTLAVGVLPNLDYCAVFVGVKK